MDHDHGTGKFRGMLCVGCNGALGTIGEDNLRDALAYVGKE